MSIVVDTNVFVAAGFNPRSSSARILRAVRDGRIDMAWSADTRRETQRIVDQIPRLSWPQFAELFQEEFEYKQTLNSSAYEYIDDPDDRKFAALGDATGSTIITSDSHLLAHKQRLSTPVMTPGEFIETHIELLASS